MSSPWPHQSGPAALRLHHRHRCRRGVAGGVGDGGDARSSRAPVANGHGVTLAAVHGAVDDGDAAADDDSAHGAAVVVGHGVHAAAHVRDGVAAVGHAAHVRARCCNAPRAHVVVVVARGAAAASCHLAQPHQRHSHDQPGRLAAAAQRSDATHAAPESTAGVGALRWSVV